MALHKKIDCYLVSKKGIFWSKRVYWSLPRFWPLEGEESKLSMAWEELNFLVWEESILLVFLRLKFRPFRGGKVVEAKMGTYNYFCVAIVLIFWFLHMSHSEEFLGPSWGWGNKEPFWGPTMRAETKRHLRLIFCLPSIFWKMVLVVWGRQWWQGQPRCWQQVRAISMERASYFSGHSLNSSSCFLFFVFIATFLILNRIRNGLYVARGFSMLP